MKIRYYLKRPGEPGDLVTDDKEKSLSSLLHQEGGFVGDAYLGDGLFAFFEDNGMALHEAGKLKYNCNLPSYGAFENRIYGNLMIARVKDSELIDLKAVDYLVIQEKYVFEE